MDEIIIASTTDTAEQMQAALEHGVKAPDEEVLSTVDEVEKPVEKKAEEAKAEEKKAAEDKPVEKKAEPKTGDEELGQRAQKRISKLVAEREGEKRRADDLEARLKALEDEKKPKDKPADEGKADAQETANAEWLTKHPEPNQDDFPDYDAFVKNWTKWEMDKREDISVRKAAAAGAEAAKEVLDKAAAKEKTDKEAAERTEQFQKFEESKVDARERYDDFDAVMEAAAERKVSGPMQYVILTSPVGHDIAYYLAQPENHELADELAEMEGPDALRELGRLEHTIELKVGATKPAAGTVDVEDKPGEKKPAAKKVAAASKAPAPISPVGGRSVATTVDLSDPNIDQATFKTLRNQQEAARRKNRR